MSVMLQSEYDWAIVLDALAKREKAAWSEIVILDMPARIDRLFVGMPLLV
jgi:hypothetical protein